MPDEHLLIEPKARTGRISLPTWLIYAFVWALGMAVTGFSSYAAANSSMNARVSVLEAEKQEILRRLDRIELLLDRRLPKELP